MNRIRRRLAWTLTLFVLPASSAEAHVARVEVVSRTDVQDGRAFGLAGGYERIVGRVYFAVKPEDAHNRQIVDLDKAPRNAQGEVEFSADLYLYRPKDMNKGNGAVLFEVSNRGGRGILRLVDGGNSSDANGEFGDGFLLREGYTIAWLGWQFDVAEDGQKLSLSAPVAHEQGGKEIRGLVRSDFTPSQKRDDMPLGHIMLGPGGGRSYAVVDPASAKSVLTVRDTPEGARQIIPRSQWRFAHSVNDRPVADPHFIHLDGGFLPGKIYEVVYEAKNPVVVGVGLAAVRDFLSYLKYDPQATAPVQRVYAVGISQSGRFLRHFLYQGFNADEQGRQVMDGVIAHVAGAGRGSFNHRFGQPSRDAQPMSSIFFPTDLFPYTDLPETDPETGETAGLLDASNRSHTAPKIFFSNTSYEYWGRSASLIHTSADGMKDAAMDQWVKDGTPPPPNAYPKIADGTLVPLSKWRFPRIPGVNVAHEVSLAYRLDFGSQWKAGIISNEPPKVGKAFAVLVPQTDADGNDLGGVRLPELQAPLATYTGWNLRDPSIGASDERVSFLGSFLPLARTAAEREKSGDPRPSIAERYASREQYMGNFAEAAMKLIQDRFLLREDLAVVLERGQREWNEIAGEK